MRFRVQLLEFFTYAFYLRADAAGEGVEELMRFLIVLDDLLRLLYARGKEKNALQMVWRGLGVWVGVAGGLFGFPVAEKAIFTGSVARAGGRCAAMRDRTRSSCALKL